jgi:hypothetical protein
MSSGATYIVIVWSFVFFLDIRVGVHHRTLFSWKNMNWKLALKLQTCLNPNSNQGTIGTANFSAKWFKGFSDKTNFFYSLVIWSFVKYVLWCWPSWISDSHKKDHPMISQVQTGFNKIKKYLFQKHKTNLIVCLYTSPWPRIELTTSVVIDTKT